MPERVQLSRRKGWLKPENTVVVARPSRWGNPFRVGVTLLWVLEGGAPVEYPVAPRAHAVALFREWVLKQKRSPFVGIEVPPTFDEIIDALAGKNLACWCPLAEPCHADVLLEFANGSGRG